MINKYIKHTPQTTTNKIKKTKIPHFLLEHFQTLIVEICKIDIPNTHILAVHFRLGLVQVLQ
jgi:hypothetical protein